MNNSTENNGGLSSYYLVAVRNPQRENQAPYVAECEDIIRALGMNFDEGNLFKELWRSAASKQGNQKKGHTLEYGANKILHYATAIHKQVHIGTKE